MSPGRTVLNYGLTRAGVGASRGWQGAQASPLPFPRLPLAGPRRQAEQEHEFNDDRDGIDLEHNHQATSASRPARMIWSATLKMREADAAGMRSPRSQCCTYPRHSAAPGSPSDSAQSSATLSASASRSERGSVSASLTVWSVWPSRTWANS